MIGNNHESSVRMDCHICDPGHFDVRQLPCVIIIITEIEALKLGQFLEETTLAGRHKQMRGHRLGAVLGALTVCVCY